MCITKHGKNGVDERYNQQNMYMYKAKHLLNLTSRNLDMTHQGRTRPKSEDHRSPSAGFALQVLQRAEPLIAHLRLACDSPKRCCAECIPYSKEIH